ncbi:MAG: TolC family protein, partial [Vitreoscilla sp.]
MPPRSPFAVLAAAALLSACAVGPDYVRPTMSVPATYKESGDWKPADPRSAVSGQAWWQAYGDPVLDGLETDARSANQNIRQAEAAYRQARAIVDADRAGLFPSLGLNLGADRTRSNTNGIRIGNGYSAGLAASWEPDLWGSVRREIESGEASAQASADDLAAARLSIQTTLAQDYLQLRIADQQRDLYATTIAA